MDKTLYVVAWDTDGGELMIRYFRSAKLADRAYDGLVHDFSKPEGDKTGCVFRFNHVPPDTIGIDEDSIAYHLESYPAEQLCRGAQTRYIGTRADPMTWAPRLNPSLN